VVGLLVHNNLIPEPTSLSSPGSSQCWRWLTLYSWAI